MPIGRIRHEAPRAERVEEASLETLQACDVVDGDRSALRDIVPADDHLAARCEALVALRKGQLALRLGVESPADDAVAQDEIEVGAREMIAELLERRDHMMAGTEPGEFRIGLESPVIQMREIGGIVGGIGVYSHEQDASDRRIVQE